MRKLGNVEWIQLQGERVSCKAQGFGPTACEVGWSDDALAREVAMRQG